MQYLGDTTGRVKIANENYRGVVATCGGRVYQGDRDRGACWSRESDANWFSQFRTALSSRHCRPANGLQLQLYCSIADASTALRQTVQRCGYWNFESSTHGAIKFTSSGSNLRRWPLFPYNNRYLHLWIQYSVLRLKKKINDDMWYYVALWS